MWRGLLRPRLRCCSRQMGAVSRSGPGEGWAGCRASTHSSDCIDCDYLEEKSALCFYSLLISHIDFPTVPAVKHGNSNGLGRLGNKKVYVGLFSTVIKRKKSVIRSRGYLSTKKHPGVEQTPPLPQRSWASRQVSMSLPLFSMGKQF